MREPRKQDAITIPLGFVRRLLAVLVVLAIVGAGVVLVAKNQDRLFGLREAAYVDATTYQALFLTGGQAYFGKLEIQGEVYLLRDVYYLNAPQESTQSLGQLLRRGSELHGPIEPMVVPASSVLFFENMRQDSQIMVAIRQIKSGNTTTPPPAATTAPAATPARTATPAPSASR